MEEGGVKSFSASQPGKDLGWNGSVENSGAPKG